MRNSDTKKSKLPLYISLGILAILILCYVTIPSFQDFLKEAWSVLTSEDEDRIREWVDRFGFFGPIVLIMAMVAQMFLIIIPSIMLMVVAILAYGPVWGSVIVLIAIFSASSIGYSIGTYFGSDMVARLIGGKTEDKISDFIKDYGFWAVSITRLNPFLSNDAISFVAGLLGMGYWKFIGATLIGIAPLTLFIAILGESTDGLKTGLLWGSLISLFLFGLYVWWDKKKR